MSQPPGLKEKVDIAVDMIRRRTKIEPKFGITLGTGLGGLVQEIDVEQTIPYALARVASLVRKGVQDTSGTPVAVDLAVRTRETGEQAQVGRG